MKILAAALALAPLLACGSKEPAPAGGSSKSESQKPAAQTASAKSSPQSEPPKPAAETPKPNLPSAAPKIEAKPPAPAPGVEPDKIKVQH
ncbi:MAG TPA: hypothetical protein VKF62_11535, partial [Planctomycetota bacterium]|nr:hypothetical protein [Planctomycetota bacterium]